MFTNSMVCQIRLLVTEGSYLFLQILASVLQSPKSVIATLLLITLNLWTDTGGKRMFEGYLICIASDMPQSWFHWLCLAEFWYNISYHTNRWLCTEETKSCSSIKMPLSDMGVCWYPPTKALCIFPWGQGIWRGDDVMVMD